MFELRVLASVIIALMGLLHAFDSAFNVRNDYAPWKGYTAPIMWLVATGYAVWMIWFRH